VGRRAGLNQLTSFARGTLNGTKDGITGTPAHSQSWSLDALGNWSSVTTDGTTQSRTANQLNQITGISGQTTPTYDAAGDKTGDEAGRTLVYDAWHRLVRVTDSTGAGAAYQYDGLGRKVVSQVLAAGGAVSETDTLYYSSAWQVLERDINYGSGSPSHNEYVWSGVAVDALAQEDHVTAPLVDGDPPVHHVDWVQQDALGNVTARLAVGGAPVRYVYDPYGKPTVLDSSWSPVAPPTSGGAYLFQGGWYDWGTGLSGFRNREMSVTLGRWVQTDPLGQEAGDPNPYGFVSDSPTTNADPTGLFVNWAAGSG
jgi:RHS repeat-associated protein